jgi:hypothetical protein
MQHERFRLVVRNVLSCVHNFQKTGTTILSSSRMSAHRPVATTSTAFLDAAVADALVNHIEGANLTSKEACETVFLDQHWTSAGGGAAAASAVASLAPREAWEIRNQLTQLLQTIVAEKAASTDTSSQQQRERDFAAKLDLFGRNVELMIQTTKRALEQRAAEAARQ